MNEYSLFSDLPEIFRRARLGVRETLRDNQLARNPVAIWRDGEVVVAMIEDEDTHENGSVTVTPPFEKVSTLRKKADGDAGCTRGRV